MPAYDVHALRKLVSALDKAAAGNRPFPEAVKYIKERYHTDADSAARFCKYLRGLTSDEGKPSKSNPVEVRHTRFDESLGAWVDVKEEAED